MQHLDDGTIHAWLDGALGAARARHVEEHVAGCGACAARVAEARGLVAAASRILTALDDVPANVVPAEVRMAAAAHAASPAIAAAAPPAGVVVPRARWWGHRYGRLAAVLAFMVAGALVVTRGAHRRDDTVLRERPHSTDVLRAERDSVSSSENAPVAAPPATPPAVPQAAPPQRRQPAPAPPTALGGASARPAPAPTLKPQVKSFAQEARQQATAAKKVPRSADIRGFTDANVAATSATREAHAADSSALARRIGEGKALQLDELVVTSQSMRAAPPRLVSVDSVQRGGMVVRRQTYAIEGGTSVVLEIIPASAMPNDSAAAAPAGALADSAVADSSTTAIHVIRWRGADGTGYTLSGPVSIDELQRVRAALGKG